MHRFKRHLFVCLFGLFQTLAPCLVAQSGFVWQAPAGSPTTPTVKFDDIYFLNHDLGMSCNGEGKVYRTHDGGATWTLVFDHPQAFFRSITIVDSLNAFVGNFGYYAGSGIQDSVALYHTSDGGTTWVPAPIPAPTRIGICGLNKVDSLHIFGVGRIDGPTSFIKSTDGGTSWSYTDMAPYCGFLVDCYFQNADTGFVIGGSDSVSVALPIILRTQDAGSTWDTVYIGLQNPASWCWKIDFPSPQTGYVSIESDAGTVNCLKTTDGGNTWTVKNISNIHFNLQGIGFVNDNVGWAGGYYGNFLFETIDGGDSWTAVPGVTNLNRIRKLEDTLLWASGKRLYKITPTPQTSLLQGNTSLPLDWSLLDCQQAKCVQIAVLDPDPQKSYEIFLYDVAGRLIKALPITVQDKTMIDLQAVPHTLIYFVISDGDHYSSKVYVND